MNIPTYQLSDDELEEIQALDLKGLDTLEAKESKREIWLKQRQGKFTSSNVYKLMTYENDLEKLPKGAISYTEEIALEILTNGMSREEYSNPAMERGNEKEIEAIERFEAEKGIECYQTGENQEFIEFCNYFGGTPDGLCNDDELIEVKCPKPKTHFFNIKNLKTEQDLKKHYPEYYWQIQGNLLATNRTGAYFISYDDRFLEPKHQILILKIERNNEDIKKLEKRLQMAENYKKEFLKQGL